MQRVKNNFRQASFKSRWKCKKCNAISQYHHYVNHNPSKDIKVFEGINISAGTGKRTKSNYELEGGTWIDKHSANRKKNN